jgi:glycosyltransferase involved in cell wall biosynthesis
MATPRFTAIVPAYNGTETVGATIRSILTQTATDLELIVVDDGSTDGTQDLVRSFQSDSRVELIEQTNGGVSVARNTGIERARGEFVSFLDHDDIWMPTYLETMGLTLSEAPRAGLGFADGFSFQHGSFRVRRKSLFNWSKPPQPLPANAEDQLVELAKNNFIWGSVTVRRVVLERVGGFDPEVNAVDDYDLWLRILAAGFPCMMAPGKQILQRAKADSQSMDLGLMLSGMERVCGKLAENESAPAEARRIAAGRVPELKFEAEAVRGDRGTLARLHRLRRSAALARARLVNAWSYRRPPEDIAEVFRTVGAVPTGA